MIKITPKMQFCQYEGHIYRIPDHMIEGLESYINHRLKQGSFLHAVLCNDLKSACMQVDGKNIRNLPAYVNFLCNYAPINCWGSPEKVAAWLEGAE